VNDLALAEAVAREAGDLLKSYYGRLTVGSDVESKTSSTDLVSEADVETEKLLVARLTAERPDDGLLGEEGADREGTSGRRWVIDPLDGTVNFLFGIPQWGVSVAVEDAEGSIAGVVYDPMREEMWACTRDGSPMLNGSVVAAGTRDDLATSMVATGFGYEERVRVVQADAIARLLPRVRDIRRLGSAALDLCWTAAGRYDAYFERGVKPWDVAAGALLCRRAGLAVRRLDERGVAPEGILVARGSVVDELQALIG
jgi:myo-inositol-1(or 4)-monophosphatase